MSSLYNLQGIQMEGGHKHWHYELGTYVCMYVYLCYSVKIKRRDEEAGGGRREVGGGRQVVESSGIWDLSVSS